MNKEIRHLHHALIDLIGMMNRPQRDIALIREAGISLDRALFPLLVGIERKGPIGVGELADGVGRDYTHRQPPGGKARELEARDAAPIQRRQAGARSDDHGERARDDRRSGRRA